MDKPNVEIKKFKTHYSREWGADGAFEAEIWINGIKCMHVNDEGNGGCYDYHDYCYDETPAKAKAIKENIKLLEDYIKTLPKVKSEFGDEHDFAMDMDMYVAELVGEFEKQKDIQKQEKKLRKLCETAICFGIPNTYSYGYFNFKRPLTDVNTLILQSHYVKARTKCIDGVEILNTNLKGLVVMSVADKLR